MILLLLTVLLLVQLQVTVLVKQVTRDEVDHDVCLTNIDQHVVLEKDWLLLSDKHSIANTQILDQENTAVWVKLDLEVSATMLLSCLLILVWNDKVIDNTFLNNRFGLVNKVRLPTNLIELYEETGAKLQK